ncbi:MAG: hypothetical protein QM739_06855 [Propionivibrio sp.]
MFNTSCFGIVFGGRRTGPVVFLQTGHSLLQKSAKQVTKGCQLGNND